MQLNAVQEEIRNFLLSSVPAAAQLQDLSIDDPLLELGVFDSSAMVETVVFCEQHFDIEIPSEELKPGSFASIRAISEMVLRALDRLSA
ncbi:MAG TPA: phosphopantetheine-binding protein [Candidatus Binataceae bacterium]|nr:phosphopantetheine-binding protein [Candidatus Binataceae bacterium]